LLPFVIVVVILAVDVGIYLDAKTQADRGTPVVFTWGSLRIDTPVEWLIGCVFLWIIVVPLYLTGRRH
jgi:hypothetical protein